MTNSAPSVTMLQIQIRGLYKSFGSQRFCADRFGLRTGEDQHRHRWLGQGKSVLMKHLMGLLQPDSGHITWTARTLWAWTTWPSRRSSASSAWFFSTRRSSIRSTWSRTSPSRSIERYRLPRSEILARVRDLLRRLDLDNVPGSKRSSQPSCPVVCRKRVDWLAARHRASDFALR